MGFPHWPASGESTPGRQKTLAARWRVWHRAVAGRKGSTLEGGSVVSTISAVFSSGFAARPLGTVVGAFWKVTDLQAMVSRAGGFAAVSSLVLIVDVEVMFDAGRRFSSLVTRPKGLHLQMSKHLFGPSTHGGAIFSTGRAAPDMGSHAVPCGAMRHAYGVGWW